MNDVITPKEASEPNLTLKPDFVDLLSCKVQMVFAAFAALVICLCAWYPTLRVGFLLDDYLHLDYVSRALNGNWADFLSNFTSNWAGSDLMKSYRPLVSVSLFVDYLIWHTNAFGFHLSNLLTLAGCSILVGLISLELSGLRGNRLRGSAAIWAALLFAVYPLHLEAGAWIIGRVDLTCTFFYLASVFCYLRFKLIRERGYFFASLISFVLAVLCKEMAYTLPVVITAIEIFLNSMYRQQVAPEYVKNMDNRRFTAIMAFWFVCGMLLMSRLLTLNELIGGYGHNTNLFKSLRNFLHADSLNRIFFPANLDLLSRVGQSAWDLRETLDKILKGSYIAVAACAAVRLLANSISLRIVLFLLLWIAVGVLPTYQIWNIAPNLVGSRLFFLSSAPFAILLAFLALPAIDSLQARLVKIISCVGSLALMLILGVWSFWLQFDMQAWVAAGHSIRVFKKQVQDNLDGNKQVLILNLPTDYSGAGMLTRGRYLKFLMGSENAKALDLTDVHANSYSAALKDFLNDPNITRVLVWNDASGFSTGSLSVWDGHKEEGSNHWQFNFASDNCKLLADPDKEITGGKINFDKLQPLVLNNGKEWTIERDGGRNFQSTETGLRIKPGNKDLVLVFPSIKLSPLDATTALLSASMISGTAPGATLIWSKQINNQSEWPSGTENYSSQDITLSPNAIVGLGQNRDWATTPGVGAFALRLPKGNYEIELKHLELK